MNEEGYWRIQGKRKDNGRWEDRSTEWIDSKPTKEQAKNLFKGIKNEYKSVRLTRNLLGKSKVLWEDDELLEQEIPIESVGD